MGSGSSGIIVSWDTPGTGGNSKTAAIVVSGNNTPLSVTVTTSAVTINSATDGSGAATSTVLKILETLYANETFRANWRARPVTDGTGVVAAASSAALSGGVNGETFTAFPEVKGVRGPNFQANVIDVTSFDSNRTREFINGLTDPGQLTFMCNYVPNAWEADQQKIFPLITAGTRRTFELQMNDQYKTCISIKGIPTGAEIAAELEQALSLNVTVKLTGEATWY
jgi:hypothetical protein